MSDNSKSDENGITPSDVGRLLAMVDFMNALQAGYCKDTRLNTNFHRAREIITDVSNKLMKQLNAELVFNDAVRIAKGCTDYGGGYRSDAALFEAYQHGIQTVINALGAAQQKGLSDTQVKALHAMGGE